MASKRYPNPWQRTPEWSWKTFKERKGYLRYGNDGTGTTGSTGGQGHRLGGASNPEPSLLVERRDWMAKQLLDVKKNLMPDLYHLFTELNRDFFNNELTWGRHRIVAFWTRKNKDGPGHSSYVHWAGVIIDLSEHDLNGKPMRDIVQTLLHEMIHAWQYFQNLRRAAIGRVVDYNRRHDAEFVRKMNEINAKSGANVTEFHVTDTSASEFLAKYTWRCDGPCRNESPYFGWLRRRTDQAPSELDGWFHDHQRKCGGRFTKTDN